MHLATKTLANILLLVSVGVTAPALPSQTPAQPKTSSDTPTTDTRWCRENASYDDVVHPFSQPFGKIFKGSTPVELTIFSIEKYDPPTGPEGLPNDQFCPFHTSVAQVWVSTAGEVRWSSSNGGSFSGPEMRGGQLNSADLNLLNSLIANLPSDSHPVPPPSQRVVVSVPSQNGEVTVRLYDRAQLPEEVEEAIRMTSSGISFPGHVLAPSHSWSRREAQQARAIPEHFVGSWVRNFGKTLAASSDGSLFAAQDYDKENLRIYRTMTGASTPQLVHTIAENQNGAHRIFATQAYFSPNGNLLLVVTNRPEVQMFNTSTWNQITDATLIPPGAVGYIPSADWKLGVAQLGPNQTFLWDGVGRRPITSLKVNGPLDWAVFSPDDQVLTFASTPAGGEASEFSRVSTKTGRELPELWPAGWHSKISGPLLWWGNGRFLVAGFSEEYTVGGLALWDSSTGHLLGTFQGCVNSDGPLTLQGSRLLAVCAVGPDDPGGVTEWTLDGVVAKIAQWKIKQATDKRQE